MAKRDYPNKNFAWYNDDDRLAILATDTTSTSGEKTTEKYDSFQGDGNLSGTVTGVTRSSSTATYTTSAVHGLTDGDRVSISGTTNFNDSDLASQTVTVTGFSTTTFGMTLSAASGDAESGLTASWASLFVDDGLRITYHSKYEELTAVTNDLKTDGGLNSALHNAVVCYVKSRLYEDIGNFQEAQYFQQMYHNKVKKHRSRRSGVRFLSVPRI